MVRNMPLNPLSLDYLPERLPHREKEITEIITTFLPLLSGKRARAVFIYGPPGIGKTAVAKYVLKAFSEKNASTAYINCMLRRSSTSMLSSLLLQLAVPVPEKGKSFEELFDAFLSTTGNTPVVIVFDEIDAIEDSRLLYALSRYAYLAGIVLISNRREALYRIDERVLSSLQPKILEFKRYTPEQIFDILAERLKLLGVSFSKDALMVIARHTYARGSDIRFGLSLLSEALRASGRPILAMEHVRAAVKSFNWESPVEVKDPRIAAVVNALKALGGTATSLQLYEKLKEKFPNLAERTFRKYVAMALAKGVIEVKGKEGKERVFQLTQL